MQDAGYRHVDGDRAASANRTWWTAEAGHYLIEHGEFLGDADFCWSPEGLREADAQLLGPLCELRSKRVLEVGAGAAQCSRWLRNQGVEAIATDVAAGMIEQSAALDSRTGITVPTLLADARALPFAEAGFDVVFTAFGAIPFVPDPHRVHREAHRVLRPGGLWVFATTHPIKWAFPDDPGEHGLRVTRSYFDRTPYVETGDDGEVQYAEFHRTLGDHIRELTDAGFQIADLIEPEWPEGLTETWGAWGPIRGAHLPGTAIFRCHRD